MITPPSLDDVIHALTNMEEDIFIAALQKVFAERIPFPEEVGYSKNHFFLGVAQSQLLDESFAPGAAEQWSDWKTMCVAYPDSTVYSDSRFLLGICQFGLCPRCDNKLASVAKQVRCSVCGTSCSLT